MDDPKWLEWRRQGIGASEAAVILGISPYSNLNEWWKDKRGLPTKEKSDFVMERGRLLEPVARARYKLLYNIEMQPKNYERHNGDELDIFRCSMDGANEEIRRGQEIKYVGKDVFAAAKSGIVPAYYYCQLQHQFLVTDFAEIDFFAYYVTPENLKRRMFHLGESARVIVKPDLDYIGNYVIRALECWKMVVDGVEPPEPIKKKRAKKADKTVDVEKKV